MSKSSTYPLQLVIGPHRSGTSVLTQTLSLMGMDIGRSLMPPSYDNPRGFWENEKIVQAHDAFLAAHNLNWTVAAHLPQTAFKSKAADRAIDSLVDILTTDFKGQTTSLVKDPRLCVLFPLWPRVAEKLGRPLHLLGTLRSPSFVASSIVQRNTLSRDKANYIALSYLQNMNSVLDAPALIYERFVALSGTQIVDALINRLPHAELSTTSATIQAVDALIYPETHKTPDDPALQALYISALPQAGLFMPRADVNALVKQLVEHIGLSALRTQFKKQASLLPQSFGDVTLPRERVAALEGGLEERDRKIKDLLADIAKRKKRLAALRSGLKDREAVLFELRDVIVEKNERIGAIEGGIKERDNALRGLKRKVKNRDRKILIRDQHIQTLDQEIANVGQREAEVYANYLALEKDKKDLDLAYEMERLRGKITEEKLTDQINALNQQIHYFRSRPVRAGLKGAAFKGFRLLRRLLPVPEEQKVKITRKFTGLSQRLQPPVMLPQKDYSIKLPDIEGTEIDFAFIETDRPVISIIIPVYNEIAQTIACLKSIYQQRVSVAYEVIIADDNSPDPYHCKLAEIEGVRYFRNPENLGFLGNCNRNAVQARGDYIAFLNNDTLVEPHWLDALYQTYHTHENVGIVGSKLVFPNGELQEAGGIIWEDASGWNWGRGQSPQHPRYNYVRDVDYVSGASFMIMRKIWTEIGGFYTGLEKAYYEDTDCCFRVRDHGYRTLYQPLSTVIHIEGLSSGTDVTAGQKKYQAVNQKIFFDTWKHVLKDHLPNAQTPEIASDRTVCGHILYVDACTPEPDKDSGSLDAVHAMTILTQLGYRVHFIPGTNFAHMGAATEALQALGIETIYHPFYSNMSQFLKERGDQFDYVILSRAEVNDLFQKQIRKACPRAKIINNTVDLHFLRMKREAALTGRAEDHKAADEMQAKELAFMKRADATIVISEHEHALLMDQTPYGDKLWTVPLIRPETKRIANFNNSRDMAFIGGYAHPPNVDAVEWLVKDIWPEIRAKVPQARLLICGSKMPDHFQDYAADDILIKGFIPDLNALLKGLRLTLAPLRYGAGLKGKVASSIGAGVPCVGTDIAFEGMAKAGLSAVKLVGNTPEDIADCVAGIYNDPEKWEAYSVAGVAYHNDNYGYGCVSDIYRKLLASLAE